MKMWKMSVVAAILLTGPALAEDYLNRAITIVVPFAAGGPSDLITRLVADRLGNQLGQRFIVQNIGGAGGTIGTTCRSGSTGRLYAA